MKASRNAIFVALLTLFALNNAGCNRQHKSGQHELRIPLGSEPPTLDPQQADTGISVFVLRQIFSTLFTYDDELKIIPMDAESYAWRNGGRVLRVVLRKDLKWSDGVPLRACQYRDALLRALDPKVPSALSEILFEIENARERKGNRVAEEAVGLKCDDEKGILEVKSLRAESPKLLHSLAYIVSAPLRKDLLALKKSEWVASGAFVLKEWTHNQRLVLEARSVHEKDLPADRQARLNRVSLPIVKDSTTALSMYESDELDVIDEIPPALISKLKDRADHVVSPYFTTYMVGFSLKANPALKNRKLRQALARVAAQDEVPVLLGGGEEIARGWIPPGLLPETAQMKKSLSDPTAARSLFKEAGFGDAKKAPRLELFFNAGERHQLLMERLAHHFKSELGLDIRLEPMEWKVLVAQLKVKAPDLYRYAWAAVYPDPIFFLELYLSDSLNNFGGWKNEEYDRIVRALAAVPLANRDDGFWKKVQRAQEILVSEDPALIPVYHYVRHVLVKPNVKGLRFLGNGTGPLKDVTKSESR